MSISDRLLIVRTKFGLSQGEISHELGISKTGYRANEQGSSLPGSKLIEGLINLGINSNWLITGNGEMLLSNADNQQINSDFLEEFSLVPGYSVQVAAGNGIVPEGERTTRKLAFRKKWLKYRGLKEKDLVLVFTKGDSMEPTINDNNTLMIDTSQKGLNDGGIYVIRTNDHLVVKRIQTTLKGFFLISDNKEYKEIEVTYNEADDLQVIGKVVWIGKDV